MTTLDGGCPEWSGNHQYPGPGRQGSIKDPPDPGGSTLTGGMTSSYRTPTLTDLPEVRFGLAEAAVLVAATACHVLDVAPRVGLVLLALVVVGSAAYLPTRFSMAVAVSAWAFLTGLVVHVGGQLTFRAADLDRLGLLVLVASLAASGAASVRHVRRRQPGPSYAEARTPRVGTGVRG